MNKATTELEKELEEASRRFSSSSSNDSICVVPSENNSSFEASLVKGNFLNLTQLSPNQDT